jgi:hypothetical protein
MGTATATVNTLLSSPAEAAAAPAAAVAAPATTTMTGVDY